MTIHLVKLCVGAQSIAEIAAWQARVAAQRKRAGASPHPVHVTRQRPSRAAELLDGGSLYWVVRGVIQARQTVLDLEDARDASGLRACAIVLDAAVIATEPVPRRAFQGWRYLAAEDAPADLARGQSGDGGASLPDALRRELISIGAW